MNYKTKQTILGLPLIHITTGALVDGRYKRGIAKGWIAIGDISFGVILSLGGAAFGGIAIGGIGIGLLAFGGLAIGGFALGGGAIGIIACGGGAIGLYSAYGGLAIAYEYAQGGLAIANHANDQLAKKYFENNKFILASKIVLIHSRWFILLAFIPVIQNLIKKIRNREINT